MRQIQYSHWVWRTFVDGIKPGVLDDKRLSFQGTTVKNAVGYSGLNTALCFQIALSSFRGETTISSLFRCGESEKEKADQLMKAIVSELQTFVHQTA